MIPAGLRGFLLSVLALSGCLPEAGPATGPLAGGTSTETEAQIVGSFTHPDGSRAVGARVTIRPADYLSTSDLDASTGVNLVTDSLGVVRWAPKDTGIYNLEAALGDTLGVLIRNIATGGKPQKLHGVLDNMGTLRVDAPMAVHGSAYTLGVYGMERLAVADSQGAFHMILPKGEYRLVITGSAAAAPRSVIDGVRVESGRETHLDSISFPPPDSSRLAFDPITVNTSLTEFSDLKSGDMDGDGDLDLIAGNTTEQGGLAAVIWIENTGDDFGAWITHTVSAKQVTTWNNYSDVVPVDLDRDGDMDVMAAAGFESPYRGGLIWFERTPGGFAERLIDSARGYVGDQKVLDMDKDGDLDILAAIGESNKVSWFRNDGGQTFTEQVVTTNAMNVLEVDAGDLDGDGDIDCISASYDDSKIAWYRNDGSGVFTEHPVGILPDAHRAMLSDIDSDGDLDIAATGLVGGVTWYENDGQGSFTPHVLLTGQAGDGSNPNWYYNAVPADLDRDGDKDLIIVSTSNGTYFSDWLENDGNQGFGVRHLIKDDYLTGLTPADFDGDGDLDLAAGRHQFTSGLPAVLVYESTTRSP